MKRTYDKPRAPRASQPTQKTPKGLEIPLPTRSEIMEALQKVVKLRPQKN